MSESWIERLADGAEFTDEGREHLKDLVCRRRTYKAGQRLLFEDDDAPMLYIIEAGWAAAQRELSDGSVQLLELFLAGQIIGLREVASMAAVSSITALTDLDVALVRKEEMQAYIDESSEIAAPLLRMIAREEAWLHERILTLGQRDAAACLAHLFLELGDRLALGTHAETLEEYALPLSQEQLGSMLGITSVHVSRTLKQLSERGILEVEAGRVRLVDRGRCEALADYQSRRMRMRGSTSD